MSLELRMNLSDEKMREILRALRPGGEGGGAGGVVGWWSEGGRHAFQ